METAKEDMIRSTWLECVGKDADGSIKEQPKREEKDMKWTRIQIKTITDAEDIIISTLYDIGLEGAQIEDKIPLTPLEKSRCLWILCRKQKVMTELHTLAFSWNRIPTKILMNWQNR